MQKILNYQLLTILLVSSGLTVSCEEADPVPDYEYVGTAAATVFSVSASNDEPTAGEEVTITITYVNRADDPAQELEALVKVGDEDFAQVNVLDESGAAVREEIIRTFSYEVPDVESGTSITVDVLLTTARVFPQRERVTIEVAE